MFNTPRKQGGLSSSTNTPTKKVPLNGLFSDGGWKCNCNPRLPATHFQVKKSGPNQGRWFYTCQEPKDAGGCGFFLWDEKAKAREMNTLMSNARSEPDTPSTIHRKVDPSEDKMTLEGHAMASNKWMADLQKKDEDEFGAWPLSQEEEEKVVAVAERTTPGNFPETPRKVKIMDSRALTPGSKRKRSEDESDAANTLPTPATTEARDEDVFGGPSTKRRLKGLMWDGNERLRRSMPSPSVTPSPFKFKDAPTTAIPSPRFMDSPERRSNAESLSSHDITEDVMNLLKDQHINEETDSKLRQLLSRHALKISGIVKGRDITRVALKAKDTKIAELQLRINALESERDMSSALLKRHRRDGNG